MVPILAKVKAEIERLHVGSHESDTIGIKVA